MPIDSKLKPLKFIVILKELFQQFNSLILLIEMPALLAEMGQSDFGVIYFLATTDEAISF